MKKLISICSLALLAIASLTAQNLYCLDLEELQDSVYFQTPLGGEIFEESNVSVTFNPYTTISGSSFWEPLWVSEYNGACCSNSQLEGQVLNVVATAGFDFSEVGEDVNFVAIQYQQNFNTEIAITVNGSFYQAASLAMLPSTMAGDINFSYTQNIGNSNELFGTLSFSGGDITQISIGGFDITLDNICFIPADLLPCEISNITTEKECVGDLDDNGVQEYTVTIDFEHELSISGSFFVNGNGNDYGAFTYTDLPITLGPFNETEIIDEFVITDQAGNCSAITLFEVGDPCIPSGDCALGPINLTFLNSDPNNYLYYSMDFVYENTSSPTFMVTVDGELLGTYLYSTLPTGLVLPCDNDGEAQIVVTDSGNADCTASIWTDQMQCNTGDCNPTAFLVEVYNCTGDSFSIDFEFDVEVPASDAFYATVGGIQYGPFEYGETFYTINDIAFNSTGEYTITIQDNLNADCTETLYFNANPCFIDCDIDILGAEAGECVDGQFVLTFAIASSSLSTNGINVIVNDEEYGVLPPTPTGTYMVTVPVGNGGPYELLVTDVNIPDCGDVYTIAEVDCPVGDCALGFDGLETLDCTGNMFNLSFGVIAVNPSAATFTLFINGENYGVFEYGLDEYFVSEIPVGNGAPYQILAQDSESEDCTAFYLLEELCEPTDCNFVIEYIEVLECTNGLFSIEYQLLGQNTNSSGHQIFMDGELLLNLDPTPTGIYTIYNIPYSPLGHTFTVVENETDCEADYDVQEFDCSSGGDCEIEVANIVSYACDGNTFTLGIAVDVVNNTSSFYTATIGGETYNLSFNSNGQYLHNIPVNATGVYELVLVDNDNPDCTYATEVAVNCGDGCNLEVTDFNVDYCTGTSLGISFDMNIESATGTTFNVFWDGEQIGTDVPYTFIASYEFADLSYVAGPHQLTVIDSENPDCFFTYLVDEIGCTQDCWIELFETEVYECDGETFTLGFGMEWSANPDDEFEIFVNDVSYGTMPFDNQFWFEIADIAYEGEGPYTLTVISVDNPDCGSNITFFVEECESDCTIIEANFNTTDCDDGTFGIIIDFEVLNSTNEFFDLYLGTNILGFFPIDQLPLTIEGIESDLASLNFSICVNDDENCCLEINIDNPCIEGDGFVWPGDANNDNTANIYDLLNIGIGYGTEGPERTTQSIEWIAQDAELWAQDFPMGPNYVFADCDGNGLIDEEDRGVILQNYGLLHGSYEYPETEKGDIDDPSLFVDLPDASEISFGNTFSAPIVFGTNAIPVENVYGLAFRLNVNPDYMDINNVQINFSPSWLGVPGVNQLEIAQTIVSESAIDVSITRIDQNNVTGFGALAHFIGIVDDIAGFAEVEVEVTNVVAIMINQELIPVNTPTETIELLLDSNEEIFKSNIRIYPNPTHGNLIIQNRSNDLIKAVQVYSIDGKLLKTYSQANEVSIQELPEGIYTLELISQAGYHLYERIIKM